MVLLSLLSSLSKLKYLCLYSIKQNKHIIPITKNSRKKLLPVPNVNANSAASPVDPIVIMVIIFLRCFLSSKKVIISSNFFI